MRTRRLVRFQLLMLVILAGLLFWRRGRGPEIPDGVVVFSDVSTGEFYRAGMRVDRASDVVISMAASFETDKADAALATYGWILDAEKHSVVWKPEANRLARDGVLAFLVDTIHVQPGQYDVFYSALGPTDRSIRDAPFLGLKPYWTSHDNELYLSVAEADAPASGRSVIASDRTQSDKPLFVNPLWRTGPVGRKEMRTFLFQVRRPVNLHVYAIGELCSTGCDYGWLEDTRTGEKVWAMEWENTQPAGGTETNRTFDGSVELNPGIYRAIYRTNGTHSPGDWDANPPYDPDGWGLALYGVDEGDVAEFDPWVRSTPLIRMTGIENNRHRMEQFTIAQSMDVFISALGEITTRGQLYDYAWLERNESGAVLWKMSREKSLPGGGDSSNRTESVFVNLVPGSYTLHFKTDGGHAYGNWSMSRPSNPERWGVALFAVDENVDLNGVFTLSAGTAEDTGSSGQGTRPETAPTPAGELLVNLERVGNDADLYSTFELEASTELYVVAQGEIATSGRWDYAWIESVDTGEHVWEMTLRNTTDAGGDDRNRRFEGRLTLPGGRYKVRYVSDLSHAFGDFGDESPDRPEEWGIRIYRTSG